METGEPHGLLGRGRHLAEPAFPDDDGAADPRLRDLLASGPDPIAAARALRGVRLLATVVAVADEVADDGCDKSSHMAVVSMVNESGSRGLLAFTGTDSLSAWNPDARPVPALGREVARSALADGAEAIVIDVAGPSRMVLAGPALAALADDLDVAAASAAVQAALAPLSADGWVEVNVRDVRPALGAPDPGVDLLVAVSCPQGAHPDGRSADQLALQAAQLLAGRADLRARVPGGLGVVRGDESR